MQCKHKMEVVLALYKGGNKDMQGKVRESDITCFFMKSSGAFYIITVIRSLATFYQEYWHFNKCQDRCLFNVL